MEAQEGKDKAKSKAESELRNRIKQVLAEKVRPWSIAETAKQRQGLHTEQLTRTLLWNGVNRRISLKLSLWASIRRGLALALLALFAAIALWTATQKSPDWRQALSFLEIGLLGLFGGMLSAFLTARDEQVNVPSYQVVVSRTSLRMLLGAAGAVVMYSVGLLLLARKVASPYPHQPLCLHDRGIVAGFSERLFIETLERAASNLHTSGSPTKEKEAGKVPVLPLAEKTIQIPQQKEDLKRKINPLSNRLSPRANKNRPRKIPNWPPLREPEIPNPGSAKPEIPNPKLQIPGKFQIPSFQRVAVSAHFFGVWITWDLGFWVLSFSTSRSSLGERERLGDGAGERWSSGSDVRASA